MIKFAVALLIIINLTSFSQLKTVNPVIKWGSWLLLQTVPSPTFFEDRDDKNSKLKFGLEWQVIPVSYSFNTNKYLSRFNILFINPVKRFTGSVETFFEPALITGDFKYAELKKFMFKTGARVVFPLAQKGEYLAFSLGAGYYRQNSIYDKKIDGVTYEAGIYSFFGMLGLKFNYNQNARSRYNIGVYFKYY
jgi:hypothetical protein